MKTESSSYHHIIWDWNGTLLNDHWLCVEVMNTMLAERNLPLLTLERYRDIFDFPVRDYYEKLGFDFKAESFEVVGMDFMIRYNERQKECRLHEGVQHVLSCLKEKGFSQYILSAREENELRKETRDLKVAEYFKHIDGLDDHYAHGKTDVGVRLLKEIDDDIRSILFIGDTCHDADVARELGIDCVLIPNGHHSAQRLERTGCKILPSLESVRHYLCG